MLEICLLGATGSIGSQVLDLIREKRDSSKLVAFSFGHNIEKALEIVEEFEPNLVCSIEEIDSIEVPEASENATEGTVEDVAGVMMAVILAGSGITTE